MSEPFKILIFSRTTAYRHESIPAGIRGGEVYQHAIFWGQTANRMVN